MGFWLGLLVPLIGYVLYPAVVVVAARFAHHDISATGPWPSVTVAIAAHNEQVTIARAVRSVLSQHYPGPPVSVLVGLDGCTDRTAGVLAEDPDPRLTVLDLPRAGKAQTDNRLVAAATDDVVVTTSAGAEFAMGSLTRLLEPLRDPRVGCTTGVFQPRRDGGASADGERLYWSLENQVMEAESRLGSLALASGTALAFRRSLFQPIPSDSDADVTVAPTVVLQGGRVIHVPGAIVYDEGPSSLRVVFRTRRRMTLGALPATLGLIPRLVRAGRRSAAVGLFCHKVCRWLAPFAAVIWLASATALVMRGDPTYRPIVVVMVVAAAAAATVGLLVARTRSAVMSLAIAQAAFTLAAIDALRGRRARTWSRDSE
jgi:cellulose synthase/poly-beta-1,6-N-acetylglucosamine synthase-like glycosyltransferase